MSTLVAVLLTLAGPGDDGIEVGGTDWPWWRGPGRDGVAPAGQKPPTAWSETENVVWKADVPGRGHGSPIVSGERVYLAACEEEKGAQSILAFDRATGREAWRTVVHPGGAMRKNKKATSASSTPACDGERLFITFPNGGGLTASALGLDGKILWQTKISDYVVHQGYGSSPAVWQSLVIVTADNKKGGAVAGLDRKTGRVVWKRERPRKPNYSSPIILTAGGRDQLILTGCDLVTSLDPLTGKELWEVPGATTECVTSTVTDGNRVFTSGGYPKNHLSAVMADGSGKLAWEITDRVYVPSLLYHDGHLFGVLDAGVAACWASDTGKEKWKERLGGTFSSSPVRVGDLIYVTNEKGKTFIYRADPSKFVPVAENQLGDEAFGTPAICGSRIYTRVAHRKGGRQERLYCIGKE